MSYVVSLARAERAAVVQRLVSTSGSLCDGATVGLGGMGLDSSPILRRT